MHIAVFTLLYMEDEIEFVRFHAEPEIFLREYGIIGVEEFGATGLLAFLDAFLQVDGCALHQSLDILGAQGILPGGFHTRKAHTNESHVGKSVVLYIFKENVRIGFVPEVDRGLHLVEHFAHCSPSLIKEFEKIGPRAVYL